MSALAQIPFAIPAAISDAPAPGGTPAGSTFIHTGTDVIEYGGKRLQVMTWDDARGNVTLSWSSWNPGTNLPVGPAGSFTLNARYPGNYADPDVVVGLGRKGLYANVVCIDRNAPSGGRAMLFGFQWNGNDFGNQAFFPVALGDEFTKHSYPNIDANERGFTAIVWQQTKESRTTVTVTSADFPTYTFTQTIAFGRSFLAGSMIDTGIIGSCYRYVNRNVVQTGVPVIDPPTGLFEQTLRPDVAISELRDGPPIVSTTFIRHFVDGRDNFSIVDSLAVKQTLYNVCEEGGDNKPFVLREVDAKEWALDPRLPARGAPRIAAPSGKSNYKDVEVVLDLRSSGCFEDMHEVRNYGKTGNWRPKSTLVSLPDLTFPVPGCQAVTNLRKREAKEPVVTYYGNGPQGDEGQYLVTWTGYNYQDIYDTDPLGGTGELDVLGSTLKAGVPEFPFGGTSIAQFYSLVNEQTAGDQHTPSVAGRHLTFTNSAHLFVDDTKGRLSFKQADNPAGGGQLRPGPRTGTAPLQAYPNPSNGAVTLQLQLRPGETARQLLVLDQLGRTVDKVAVGGEAQEQTLTWKPAAQLPTGHYVLKLTTSERSLNLSISRE